MRVHRTATTRTWQNELVRVGALLGAPHEARVLVEEVSGTRLDRLYADLGTPVPDDAIDQLDRLVSARLSGIPLQYLIGHWPFRHLELVVDGRALIPRPETEVVVGVALVELARLRSHRVGCTAAMLRVADLGTGGGAIACALVNEDTLVEVVAIDRSAQALALATENVARLAETERSRVTLVEGSWFEPIAGGETAPFDLVISNPPYVSRTEWEDLDPEVRDHDPSDALVAGESGLEDLERIIAGVQAHLRPGGVLVCEIGATQAESVRSLARRAGASNAEVQRDLAGRDRILVARFSDG